MLIAPAVQLVHPNYTMPELIVPYNQASGAFDLLPNGEPTVRLGEDDLAVYLRRIDVRTMVAAGQATYNSLPSSDIIFEWLGTAAYRLRSQAIYDHHDTAAAGRYGVSLTDVYRLANHQGFAQFARIMLLFGANPANGEGVVNAQGATTLNLPADSFGHTTVETYDNGEMAQFLISQIGLTKNRTNNLGQGRKFVILAPQETLEPFEYNIVQLVQYQRPGAGTASTAETVKAVTMANGDEVIWAYDDTLIGKGAGATNLVIVAMPEVAKPKRGTWNTNAFAAVAPGLDAMVLQFCDMPAPREITAPLALGAVSTLFELSMTSGWFFRPEGLTLVSMQQS